MNVTLPLWVVAAQWVLLFGLGVLVVAMYRQMGDYQEVQRTGPESAGLTVGAVAPAFDFVGLDSAADTKRRFNPQGQWSLLLFADPRCAGCERALAALDALWKQGGVPQLRALVITPAAPMQVTASEAFRTTTAEVALVTGDEVADHYQVRKTPFAYVIDPSGVIRAKGVTEDPAALRGLLKPITRPSIPLVPVVASSARRS